MVEHEEFEFKARSVEEALSLALRRLGVEREQVDVEVLDEGNKGIFGIGAREARIRVRVRSGDGLEEIRSLLGIGGRPEEPEEAVQKAPEVRAEPKPGKDVRIRRERETREERRPAEARVVSEAPRAKAPESTRAAAARQFLADVLKAMDQSAVVEANEDAEGISIEVMGSRLGNVIGRRGQTLDALQYLTSLVVNKGQEEHKRVVLDVEGYRRRRTRSLEEMARRLAEKARRTRRRVILEPMPAHERRIVHLALQNEPDIETASEGEEPYRKVIITVKR
ncbi:MAG: RNA-binding cell elongation regulator Jag/EloR [Bacillota bacterium]